MNSGVIGAVQKLADAAGGRAARTALGNVRPCLPGLAALGMGLLGVTIVLAWPAALRPVGLVSAAGATATPTARLATPGVRTAIPPPIAVRTPLGTRTATPAAKPSVPPATETPTSTPNSDTDTKEETWYAVATYYSWEFAGQETATGNIYDPSLPSAACHRNILGEWIKVTNPDTDCSVVVQCNDTGPFHWSEDGWEHQQWWRIDLSEAAFAQIAPLDEGQILVMVTVLKGWE